MLYRIQLDLSFETEQHFTPLAVLAKAQFIHAVTIKPGLLNEQKGFIKTTDCNHDLDVVIPCIETFCVYTT